MRKNALLIAAGFALLAPSFAQAATSAAAQMPMPCCQDTLKLFQVGADAWRTPNTWTPYQPVAFTPYVPPAGGTPICCQDTLKLFWTGIDAWGWQQPAAAKTARRKK